MQIVVINIDPEELTGLRSALGIDDLKGRIVKVDQSVENLIQGVQEMKAASDQVTAKIDQVIAILDEIRVSPEDRVRLDQAVSSLRAEKEELNAAYDRLNDADGVDEDGEDGGDTPTDPNSPNAPVNEDPQNPEGNTTLSEVRRSGATNETSKVKKSNK